MYASAHSLHFLARTKNFSFPNRNLRWAWNLSRCFRMDAGNGKRPKSKTQGLFKDYLHPNNASTRQPSSLLKVFFFQICHLRNMVEQTGFERFVAVDRHGEANDTFVFSINMMTSVSTSRPPTMPFEHSGQFLFPKGSSYGDF